ncbi:GNAT family N-acetyltransferase [Amnibacterium endophyticum]|uniref:GNAT family N-acetyltransferase n=1 Tax=Amnibacterium endophyticum TaxID=2109337 RepID=A0ABW4LBL0_9MICO
MTVETADQAHAYGRTLLVGDRVRLRALRDDDLPLLDAWWEDPEQQALQQLAVRPRPAGSNAETHRRWSANADASAAGFSVETHDGLLVGHMALWGAKLPERDAHLGALIGAGHQGRGYGTEAVRLMVRYGFLAMGLNRIQLETFSFNDRARRAYARAGFVEEGVRREAVWIDGGFADEVIMSILRREWTP